MKNQGFTAVPLSFSRKMVRAAASMNQKNAIHSITEVDITIPHEKIKKHFKETGEKLSFTGYIITCFAQVIKQYPQLNSFIKGTNLYTLMMYALVFWLNGSLMGRRFRNLSGLNAPRTKHVNKLVTNSKRQRRKPETNWEV